ncbi:MAG: GtrA family protein [Hyphomicrobium sp.]
MSGARVGAGFVASGALAFAADASALAALTSGLALDPLLARIPAIAFAITIAYFAHRRLTFSVSNPPSFREFAKFASVASGVAILNYAVYAGIILAFDGVAPLVALLASSALAMIASFVGYCYGVFRRPG